MLLTRAHLFPKFRYSFLAHTNRNVCHSHGPLTQQNQKHERKHNISCAQAESQRSANTGQNFSFKMLCQLSSHSFQQDNSPVCLVFQNNWGLLVCCQCCKESSPYPQPEPNALGPGWRQQWSSVEKGDEEPCSLLIVFPR